MVHSQYMSPLLGAEFQNSLQITPNIKTLSSHIKNLLILNGDSIGLSNTSLSNNCKKENLHKNSSISNDWRFSYNVQSVMQIVQTSLVFLYWLSKHFFHKASILNITLFISLIFFNTGRSYWGRFWLCDPGWPETPYEDNADLKLTEILLPLSPEWLGLKIWVTIPTSKSSWVFLVLK